MILNNFYKLYLKSTISLVRGVRLKSETTAKAINDYLGLKGYHVDLDHPDTWRYYLNLAGYYHESNAIMTVISHDTYQEIEFTRENMLIHLLTARNYTIDSQYYQELVSRYPDQEILIQGIIDPVEMDVSIPAKDHTILSYPKQFIEGNESYLIPSVQKYIDNFFGTRHNPDYTLFDPFYYVKLLSGLSTKLVLEVIRLRHSMCKTDKAHSFHVRQYLLSNSEIGKEFRYMNQQQRMWFYRNIRYLNRNVGKDSTFKLLTENVLTTRGYSLVGYNLSKTVKDIQERLVPTVEMTQINLNDILPAAGSGDKEVLNVMAQSIDAAPDNLLLYSDHVAEVTEVGETSRYGTVPTKVLESNAIDRTDSEPFTISEISLNHWIYLSHFGRYNSVIQVINPISGERYNLSMKDAFILFLYTYNAGLGIFLNTVPTLSANRVLREPLPTFNELRPLADRKLVPDYYINHILSTQPVLGSYISIETFRGFCREVWDTLFRHREMRFFAPDYRREGQLHTLVDRCYMDITINLANEMGYPEWLAAKGIYFDNMTSNDYMTIAQGILSTCTGADLQDSTSMAETHAAMIRIMRTLSSYSVQYLAEINDSAIKVIDGKIPSLSDNTYMETVQFIYDLYTPRVMRTHTRVRDVHRVVTGLTLRGAKFSDEISTFKIPVNVDLLSGTGIVNKMSVETYLPTVSIRPMAARVLDTEVVSNNPTLPIGGGQFPGDIPTLPGYQLSPERLNNFLNRG